MTVKLKTVLTVTAVMIAATGVIHLVRKDIRRHAFPESVRVILDFPSEKREGIALTAGYNHHLFKLFCTENNSDAHITLASDADSPLDSLAKGSADIVLLPFSDSLRTDSTHIVIRVDSAGLWILPKKDRHNSRHLTRWLKHYVQRPEYAGTRETFLGMYDPAKHTDCGFISPYDSIVRLSADSLGWDWRLLSAVIYCESEFRIEARSRRGASGLMQVMPGVAESYGYEDLLDPQTNLQAGTRILNTIQTKYRLWGSGNERLKYILSCYNAGAAKVQSCVKHAIGQGVDPSIWDNVAGLVPEDPLDTADVSEVLDSETVGYVRRVMYIYRRYRQICPEE